MIRRCDDRDFELIWTIINDGAQAYKGTIPADRWTEPYMSREKLQDEIDEGVVFWGYEEAGGVGRRYGHPTGPGRNSHSARLCSHQQPEARNWWALAIPVAGAGKRPDLDRHVGGCGVGHPLL